jgi:hypothetical protein
MARSNYTPRPWREVVHPVEPIVIRADDIVAYLERSGRPRMAEFVRDFDAMQARQAAREQRLREDYEAVVERLHQYEPPTAEYVARSYKPPPEASD